MMPAVLRRELSLSIQDIEFVSLLYCVTQFKMVKEDENKSLDIRIKPFDSESMPLGTIAVDWSVVGLYHDLITSQSLISLRK